MRIARSVKILLNSFAVSVVYLVLSGSIAYAAPEPSPTVKSDTNVSIVSVGTTEADSILKTKSIVITSNSDKNIVSGNPTVTSEISKTQDSKIVDAENPSIIPLTASDNAPGTALKVDAAIVASEAHSTASLAKTVVTPDPMSLQKLPILIQKYQIASSRSQFFSHPYSDPLQSNISNNDVIAYSTANSKLPTPAPEPIAPIGMVSAILALFSQAIPGNFSHPILSASQENNLRLIVLTMVVLAVALTARTTVVSYGTWLKLMGFITAARSGLPNFFSSFVTPRLMGYASAPAPFS